MLDMPGYDDISTIPLEDLCLWTDASMGLDLPNALQTTAPEFDTVDKDGGTTSNLRWERVASEARERHAVLLNALSWQRVRLPLSLLHPCLNDLEFWTLDLRSSALLLLAIVVLVTFGMALYTFAR